MNITTRVIYCAAAFCAAVIAGSAQEFVPGKVYVAEITGGVAYTVPGGRQQVWIADRGDGRFRFQCRAREMKLLRRHT